MTILKLKFCLPHILCLLVFWGCGQVETRSEPQADNIATPLADRAYAIIPFQQSEGMPFDRTFTATALTESEIYKTDSIVQACILINQKALPAALKNHFAIDFSKYKRQYVTVINSENEKEVWVNCFCQSPSVDWTKEVVLAKDGGNCYFNVIVNLAKTTCRDFVVNDAP